MIQVLFDVSGFAILLGLGWWTIKLVIDADESFDDLSDARDDVERTPGASLPVSRWESMTQRVCGLFDREDAHSREYRAIGLPYGPTSGALQGPRLDADGFPRIPDQGWQGKPAAPLAAPTAPKTDDAPIGEAVKLDDAARTQEERERLDSRERDAYDVPRGSW